MSATGTEQEGWVRTESWDWDRGVHARGSRVVVVRHSKLHSGGNRLLVSVSLWEGRGGGGRDLHL